MFYFFFASKIHFRHNRFSTLFFSIKIAESGKIGLVRCIIDFKDIQVWLGQFSLNLNACKVMMVFFKILPENLKNTVITLQALRFKLNCLNQTCISLKSIMQLTKTIFPDSAIFIDKKRVENRLWRKSGFLWRKKNISLELSRPRPLRRPWCQPKPPCWHGFEAGVQV